MNIKRFVAPTAREALAKARLSFGDATLILSNRPTATGVEVMATSEDHLHQISLNGDAPAAAPKATSASARPAPVEVPVATEQSSVKQDTQQMAMSTLSFQDYVRERMLRRRHDELQGAPSSAQPAVPGNAARGLEAIAARLSATAAPAEMSSARAAAPAYPASVTQPTSSPADTSLPAGFNAKGIVDELQNMKDMIEERFNMLSWLGQARQSPVHCNLMLKMVKAGYSPGVCRAILEHLPNDLGPSDAARWLVDVLARNVKTDAGTPGLAEEGGVFALVGATGVGKTTTTAKLAANCVRNYGAQSVGLITLDTYRVAAHEQLRAYGRMMGIVAHLAHDQAALQDLLQLLSGKKMVLIDTTGVAPRDPRISELLDVINLPQIKRVTVLNAASQGESSDEAFNTFKTEGPQSVILTKIDEAVKLGAPLDVAIRHQFTLRGVTTGQRVPEDWERADAAKLVRVSMRTASKSSYDASSADLGFLFN